ncbi:hypothetical protein BBF96_09250 [Anoxybacter fermentans]|uniref:Transporter n=1 Tax=Anoxybacter fermentans TaxID=1323375 RepID=A0A3S9SZ17_9FIRM|nr:TolC family protein [Anoxybacter fermentans]AZR73557.1 hypothetical protein BBF96_09250 [Anoxybacter fermentans]
MRSKYQWILIILFVIGWSSVLQAVEPLTLDEWIERVFEKNPNYQLGLKDYNLSLEELESDKHWGINRLNLSLPAFSISQDGLENNSTIEIQYTIQLPYQIELVGRNTIQKDSADKIQFNGNLMWNFNLWDFRNSSEVITWTMDYLGQQNEFYQLKANLVCEVVDKYYQLLIKKYQLDVAQKQLEKSRLLAEEAQIKYDAGMISEMVLDQNKGMLNNAKKYYKKLQLEFKKAERDFTRLYGQLEFDETFAEQINLSFNPDCLELETEKVDVFLENWNKNNIEKYLNGIYSYRIGFLAVKKAEAALEDLKKSKDWQVNIGVNLNYSTDKNANSFSGTIGVTKELFNPSLERNIKRAEIQLEREKLAFEEMKNDLIFALKGQVEQIYNLQSDLAEAAEEFKEILERNKRCIISYNQGYLSELELLDMKIEAAEKIVSILQLRQQLVLARLTLGKTLCFDEFYK